MLTTGTKMLDMRCHAFNSVPSLGNAALLPAGLPLTPLAGPGRWPTQGDDQRGRTASARHGQHQRTAPARGSLFPSPLEGEG